MAISSKSVAASWNAGFFRPTNPGICFFGMSILHIKLMLSSNDLSAMLGVCAQLGLKHKSKVLLQVKQPLPFWQLSWTWSKLRNVLDPGTKGFP